LLFGLNSENDWTHERESTGVCQSKQKKNSRTQKSWETRRISPSDLQPLIQISISPFGIWTISVTLITQAISSTKIAKLNISRFSINELTNDGDKMIYANRYRWLKRNRQYRPLGNFHRVIIFAALGYFKKQNQKISQLQATVTIFLYLRKLNEWRVIHSKEQAAVVQSRMGVIRTSKKPKLNAWSYIPISVILIINDSVFAKRWYFLEIIH
jgi:hypothetical protein